MPSIMTIRAVAFTSIMNSLRSIHSLQISLLTCPIICGCAFAQLFNPFLTPGSVEECLILLEYSVTFFLHIMESVPTHSVVKAWVVVGEVI